MLGIIKATRQRASFAAPTGSCVKGAVIAIVSRCLCTGSGVCVTVLRPRFRCRIGSRQRCSQQGFEVRVDRGDVLASVSASARCAASYSCDSIIPAVSSTRCLGFSIHTALPSKTCADNTPRFIAFSVVVTRETHLPSALYDRKLRSVDRSSFRRSRHSSWLYRG